MIYHEYIGNYQNALNETETLLTKEPTLKGAFSNIIEKYDLEFIGGDTGDLLNESQKGLKKVKEIITGLKNFAYAGDDSFLPIDLNKCISDTLSMVKNQLKYHCDIQADYCSQAIISGNEGKICQVLTNLLINAGQAITENGKIAIRTRQSGDKLIVQVADNGCGIPSENLKKLFDPFFTRERVLSLVMVNVIFVLSLVVCFVKSVMPLIQMLNVLNPM